MEIWKMHKKNVKIQSPTHALSFDLFKLLVAFLFLPQTISFIQFSGEIARGGEQATDLYAGNDTSYQMIFSFQIPSAGYIRCTDYIVDVALSRQHFLQGILDAQHHQQLAMEGNVRELELGYQQRDSEFAPQMTMAFRVQPIQPNLQENK
ncbi:hypothetical protein BHM03_00047594 [Ensete ventricosum]|nr:hypothetical protein BHM03_00047594 [Ensete ventricosum]